MAALEDAKAHPENFDMDVWFSDGGGFTKDREDFSPPCGTTACYAGFVALRVAPVGSMVRACAIIAPGADGIDVEAYATEALDISPAQAATLFYLRDRAGGRCRSLPGRQPGCSQCHAL